MKKGYRVLGFVFGHGLFWGWNLLFTTVLWVGLGPMLLFELVVATAVGMVPWHIAACCAVLCLLPAVSMGIGLWKLRSDPGRLLSMFYGIQFPLMLLCLLRLFAVNQLMPATALALAVTGLGSLGLLRTLLHGPVERSPLAQWIRLVAQAAYGVVGLWVGALVALYCVPVLGLMGGGLVEVLMHPQGLVPELIFAIPGIALVTVTMVVLLVFPAAMLGISLRGWQLVQRATARRLGAPVAWLTSLGTASGLVLAFALTSLQPQGQAFSWLEAADDDAGRHAALEHSVLIRRGLLNARLAPERTFEADPEGSHVYNMYADLAGSLALVPQTVWRGLMAPFVYHPQAEGWVRESGSVQSWVRVPQDVANAQAAYQEFFDVPMARAERDVLVASKRQTWSWEAAEASLNDIGGHKVHLAKQEITVQPHGDLAVVTLHDVYRNRTWNREEVLVAFNLPETAAVTGLWLGPDADRESAFTHVVAPRGAAQEVYKAEVRQRVDPALLEQVGPRQYRLRAFPVEPRTGDQGDVWTLTSEGPDLHLWLEVVVPVHDGSVPLPRSTEVRNLFWDGDTERTIGGVAVADVDSWTPGTVEVELASKRSHEAVVAGFVVAATPRPEPHRASLGTVTVLVDGTRSMAGHRAELAHALDTLGEHTSQLDLYCTREAQVGRCEDFDPATALFWGARPLEDALGDVAHLSDGAEAVIVLTDAGSYELATEDPVDLDWNGPPLWLVHLGATLPIAYPDPTLDAMQRSEGGIATSADELLVHLADPRVRDGWHWTVTPTAAPDTHGPFAAMAARRAVASLDASQSAHGLDGLDSLDAIHAIAVGHSVVTPYSSMIVLVNERQRDALKRASEADDRFEREVETGGSEFAPVTSAPEPTTWLLLAAGGGVLLAGRRRRRQLQAGH